MRSHVLKLSAVMAFHAFRGRSLRAHKITASYVQFQPRPLGGSALEKYIVQKVLDTVC